MLKKILVLLNLAFIILILGLSGCGKNEDDLDNFMKETKAKPGGKLDPLPEFIPAEPFTYAASGMRSPFQRPQREEEKGVLVAEAPDLTRPKEVLEGFAIDQISMVGTLQGVDSKLWVLLNDGAGGVYRVGEGNYVGRNFGKITKVSLDKVDIIEVVPDGRGGWLARSKTIEIKEK